MIETCKYCKNLGNKVVEHWENQEYYCNAYELRKVYYNKKYSGVNHLNFNAPQWMILKGWTCGFWKINLDLIRLLKLKKLMKNLVN